MTTEDENLISSSNGSVTFASLGVCEPLCEAAEALGWKAPTKIQQESLPEALKGRDIIGLAETGSGKTGAFALPILQSLLDDPSPYFACVLAPTRELAFQIAQQFEALGNSFGIKVCTIVGGIDQMSQAIALAKKPHIIVGTPGRVADHLEHTKGFSLRSIKYLVLDEADRMLSLDFEEALNAILASIPSNRHTFLFSATMTSAVSKLQRASLKNPVKIQVSEKYQTVSTWIQEYVFLPAKLKEAYLVAILHEFSGQTCILFTSTCAITSKLTLMLQNLGFQCVSLHGQMTQPKRLNALAKFKAGSKQILVATDVASRGLDIPSVDLVVNFDVPANAKDYIHRVGRTARAGRAGRAVTMVTQYDVELYQRIEHTLGTKLAEFPLLEENVHLLLERVAEAARLASIELRERESADTERGSARQKRSAAASLEDNGGDEHAIAEAIATASGETRAKLGKFVMSKKPRRR